MNRIIFNLKREWYDKIASGKKTVEYRSLTRFWMRRLNKVLFEYNDGISAKNWVAIFRLGYSRKYPDIVRRITKIDIGPCPYVGWDGEYFRIHFEKGAK